MIKVIYHHKQLEVLSCCSAQRHCGKIADCAVTLIVALVEIDPALGAEMQQLDQPGLPDRFQKALKSYRAGFDVKLEKIL